MNATTVYVSIILPITMGYMKHQKEETGSINWKPLLFPIFLLAVQYFKQGHLGLDYIWFNIRAFLGI